MSGHDVKRNGTIMPLSYGHGRHGPLPENRTRPVFLPRFLADIACRGRKTGTGQKNRDVSGAEKPGRF